MPRKTLHPAVKKKSDRMKKLGEAYRRGDFGSMTWREVIKKYLGSDKPVDQLTGSTGSTRSTRKIRSRRKSKSKPKRARGSTKTKRKSNGKSKPKRKSTKRKSTRRQTDFVYFDL